MVLRTHTTSLSGIRVSWMLDEYSVFTMGSKNLPFVFIKPFLVIAREVLESRGFVDCGLVVQNHVPWVKHVRSVWCYELEEELRVLEPNNCILFRIIMVPRTSPSTVRVAPCHDHLDVHSLNSVEALLSVPRTKDKRREQERLADLELHIHFIVRCRW